MKRHRAAEPSAGFGRRRRRLEEVNKGEDVDIASPGGEEEEAPARVPRHLVHLRLRDGSVRAPLPLPPHKDCLRVPEREAKRGTPEKKIIGNPW